MVAPAVMKKLFSSFQFRVPIRMIDDIDYSRFKIVIIDSDNFYCQQLQSELEDVGFQVEYDRNIQMGLKRINRWRPHIVVSDYNLHSMDYLEFTAEIEKLPIKVTLVVVSSSHLDGSLIAQLTNLSGVSLAVQKPIAIDKLSEKITDLIPGMDHFHDILPEENENEEESNQDFGLDDSELQREISRLKFEGKELPRIVNSLKVLTETSRNQPHNSEYFKEALNKSERTIVTVRNQRLSHLEEPFLRVNELLVEIKEQGRHPALNEWDQINELLDNLLENKSSKVGKVSLPPIVKEDSPLEQHPQPIISSAISLKFLVIGTDYREELLNLGCSSNVNFEFIASEEALSETDFSVFDLILLQVSAAMAENRAIKLITDVHHTLRTNEACKNKPLVVLGEIESLHARVVTSHLADSYWFRWSALKGNLAHFKALRVIASRVVESPVVLVINSDIGDSEDLLRELSRYCKKVDVISSSTKLIDQINNLEPDVVVINERLGELSGIDIARAIKDSLDFRQVLVVLETASLSERTMSGATLAGIDGIVCKDSGYERMCQLIISIHQRKSKTRLLEHDLAGTQNVDLPISIKDSIDTELQNAILGQTPFSVCIIKILNHNVEDFRDLWMAALEQTNPDAKCLVHSLSEMQIVISVTGIRRKGIEKVVDKVHETIAARGIEQIQPKFQYTIRCYPDDALTLTELIQAEA